MVFAYTFWSLLGQLLITCTNLLFIDRHHLGIVNVGLLYNTFRVLGPAFDHTVYKESEMGSHERHNPSQSKGNPGFDYPTPSYRSPTIAAFGQFSPKSSIGALLPVHQERSASIGSSYNYPNSPSIGRAITPVSELSLQRSVTPPEAVAQKYPPSTGRSLGIHDRHGSNESLGLPAAPRRTRSPVLHQPSMEQIRVVHGTWSPVNAPEHTLPRSTSAETFGKRTSGSQRMTSELTPDYDRSSWDSRYSTKSESSDGRPLLESVARIQSAPRTPPVSSRALPSPSRHSRSFSAVPTLSPAPTGRQRAVLVSRYGSVGNASDFAQRRAT
ncbi:hypothetical protein C0991_007373 [Blastosporella zonata]|nr:hypothetical protein C0991_007373 [Blastosporella zonata]